MNTELLFSKIVGGVSERWRNSVGTYKQSPETTKGGNCSRVISLNFLSYDYSNKSLVISASQKKAIYTWLTAYFSNE